MNPACAQALDARRESYNSRFAQARRQRPELDGAAFLHFLGEALPPLVERVAVLDPGAVDALVSSAYDIALELVAQRLAGPAAITPWIAQGWTRLLPQAGRFLRDAPQRTLASVSNALHHLGDTAPAGPQRWLELMHKALPVCDTLDIWLQAGQVAAWLAGLAQYRAPALALLGRLPTPLQAALLELEAAQTPADVLIELALDPWFEPWRARETQIAVRARIGAFSGLGGVFTQPPTVAAQGEALLLRSGTGCFELHADAFGQTLHRCDPHWFAQAPQARLPAGWRLTGTQLHTPRGVLDLRGAGAITSFASTAHSVLISHAASFRVSVVAVQP